MLEGALFRPSLALHSPNVTQLLPRGPDNVTLIDVTDDMLENEPMRDRIFKKAPSNMASKDVAYVTLLLLYVIIPLWCRTISCLRTHTPAILQKLAAFF